MGMKMELAKWHEAKSIKDEEEGFDSEEIQEVTKKEI